MGYIPSGAIITYAERVLREGDPRELDRIIRMVRAIDREFVAIHSKSKSDQPKAEP